MRPAIVVFSLVLASAMVHAQQPDLYDVDTVRTLELTFHQRNWWQQLTNNYSSKTYIKADLKVGSVTYKDVGVRFRGNSSYKAIGSSQKKPSPDSSSISSTDFRKSAGGWRGLPSDWGVGAELLPLAPRVWRTEAGSGASVEGARAREWASSARGFGSDIGEAGSQGGG